MHVELLHVSFPEAESTCVHIFSTLVNVHTRHAGSFLVKPPPAVRPSLQPLEHKCLAQRHSRCTLEKEGDVSKNSILHT